MADSRSILIIQTAFPGDVVLTLPLAQAIKRELPGTTVGFVAIPKAAGLLTASRAVDRIFIYDKRGGDAGPAGFVRLALSIRSEGYDCALIPQRYIRSALLACAAGIGRRIGFDTGPGALFMTDRVPYRGHSHEIGRNLSLLVPMGIAQPAPERPVLEPSQDDCAAVDRFLRDNHIDGNSRIAALAPGSVWFTKRWLPERFAELAEELVRKGFTVVCVGGKEDVPLCEQITSQVNGGRVFVAAGKLSLTGSAELLRRCAVLVSNDSAPVHCASAMQTPVVAIFGATVPEFGFAPFGERNRVLGTPGLSCRPCSTHGGNRCPIGTMECMKRVEVSIVLDAIDELLNEREPGGHS